MNSSFEGIITAVATPFYKGQVDEASYVKLIHHQLEGGVSGIVVNGTTGESPTLTPDEVKRLFDVTKGECKGRAQVIVGTGSNSTADTIENTKLAESWGADGALVVVPYYNRPPQRGMLGHFSQVARSTQLPVILYNVPTRTVASLESGTVAKLAEEENIVGIKDATGKLEILEELKQIKKNSFALLSGDDGTGVDFCLRGGHGIISVISNLIPKALVELVSRARKGDPTAAQDYKKYDELMKWLYIEPNPIPVKWALAEMGLFRSPELRLPLVSLDETHAKGFRECLKKLNLV